MWEAWIALYGTRLAGGKVQPFKEELVSLRRRVVRIVGLLTVLAMAFGVLAGAASAQKVSQKAKVRAQLRHAIKKNPRVIRSASFLKKARAVDFVLPVTIRIGHKMITGAGPVFTQVGSGSATLDLGESLGTRSLALTGALPAEIEFADSFDGGGLGNVKLRLLDQTAVPGMGLTTTSLPLLSNNDTATVPRGVDPLNPSAGCQGFNTVPATSYLDAFGNAGNFADGVDNLTNSTIPAPNGVPDGSALGVGPYSPDNPSNPGNVVLRTGNLNLGVAHAGTTINPPGTRARTTAT